ncbi:MAG: hypothetical protein CM15mP108_0030 [Gammaproteobacteria bacterium]|nr:MAG: hypothetical protein CM15mP108_0030 [Gammaproteobacteria bacterium]
MQAFQGVEHLVHFFKSAPYKGGIAFDESAFFSISSGISSESNNFSQSINSEVDGFFFSPGIFVNQKIFQVPH